MRLICHCERVRSTSVAIYVLGFWIATNRLTPILAMTIGGYCHNTTRYTQNRNDKNLQKESK